MLQQIRQKKQLLLPKKQLQRRQRNKLMLPKKQLMLPKKQLLRKQRDKFKVSFKIKLKV